ncbi:conserved hypothetical protein [Gammaproteobacteria bacterium]
MTARHSPRDDRMRQLLAQEAARIMETEGIHDHYLAKRKAAERLGAEDTRNLPRNTEIEQARSEFLRLFQADTTPVRLRALREAALQAMKLLSRFQPRLVGSLLSGTVGIYSDIELHLFSETQEEISLFLDEHRIPYEQEERRIRVGRDSYRNFPVYGFRAGVWTVDLTIFHIDGLRQPPLSPVDGRPERRANLAAVSDLLEEQDPK